MMHHADIALEMANVGQDRKFTLRLPILLKTQAQALQRLCERRLQSHGVNAEQVLPPVWSIEKTTQLVVLTLDCHRMRPSVVVTCRKNVAEA